jgi:PAS domain S-box-containing protein
VKDKDKTKEQLMSELVGMRQRIAELEASESERKWAEALGESEARFRTLVEAASRCGEAIVMLQDTEEIVGACTFANEEVTRILGYTQEELTHRSWLDMISPHDREAATDRYRRRVSGEVMPGVYEIALVAKDGTEVPIELTASGTQFRDKSANVTYFRDITERKRAEEALRKAHDELESKVAERTRELAQANIQLKEMDRLKSEFLATMSHELRTPLNSIIGFTGMILQGLTGEINEEQRKQLSMVYGSAKHLLGLINDILDLSRIESGKMEISTERFKVQDVVSEVSQSLSPMISQKGLRLVTEMPDETPEK